MVTMIAFEVVTKERKNIPLEYSRWSIGQVGTRLCAARSDAESATAQETPMLTIQRSTLYRLLLAASVLTSGTSVALAGPKAYIGNFADNTVSVIDTAAGNVVATIPVAEGPHGMAMTSDGHTVYVTGDGSTTLSVIDTASDKVVKTIEVGKTPNGLALTSDGKFLLVAIYGEDRIDILDTATQAVVASIGVAKPHTISVSPDGASAYITSQEPGHFALVVIDLAKRTVAQTIPLEKTPRDAEFAYDGKAFYFTEAGVSAIQVLDPATNKIVAEIPTGVSPHYVKAYANTIGVAVVQGPGEVLVFDPATNKPVRSIAVGKQPHWLTMSGDGKTAFVTNEGSNDLSIVDIESGKTTSVTVGKMPRKLVVQQVTQAAAVEPKMLEPKSLEPKILEAKILQANLSDSKSSEPKISIVGFAFGPQSTTIHEGDSITWSNDDGAAHTVTFKDGSAGAKSLSPGQAFTRTFDKPGTFDYVCSYHPYMMGQVTVSEK
jgi:YVTN family beta-propeller protein